MFKMDYYWNRCVNKTADETFYLDSGSCISAFKILNEKEWWWLIFKGENDFTMLPERDYEQWRAENGAIPFLDF